MKIVIHKMMITTVDVRLDLEKSVNLNIGCQKVGNLKWHLSKACMKRTIMVWKYGSIHVDNKDFLKSKPKLQNQFWILTSELLLEIIHNWLYFQI